MAREGLSAEALLLEHMEQAGKQRKRSWVHWPASQAGHFILMHNMPLPINVHWGGIRDTFCTGYSNGCVGCGRGQGWKGKYCWAIFDLVRKQHGGLDLTPEANRQLFELDLPGPSRAGFKFTLRKEDGKVHGRFMVSTERMYVDPKEFGKPCDIVQLVLETYNVPLEALDPVFVENLGYPTSVQESWRIASARLAE